jgi:hypothetical protein
MSVVGGQGFNQAIQNAGGILQRAIATQATNSGKAVALSIRPLIPMIVAGSALLYHQGTEANKPGGGERNAWWNILLESSLAYLVLRHTSGVYPLFGIGLAAYRAGQQPNALEQVKAVVNTALTMFLGYVGVQFMGGMSKMADQMDDQAIYRALRDQTMMGQRKPERHINQWLQHLDDRAQNFLDPADAKGTRAVRKLYGDLRQNLLELKEKLAQLNPAWTSETSRFRTNPPNPGSQRFQTLVDESMKLKAQAAEKLEVLGKDAYKGMANKEARKAAKGLMGNIHHSQSAWTRMVRGMNPVFGYIIMGLVVGAPLARWINSWVGQKRPDLQKKSFKQALIPTENRVMLPTYQTNPYSTQFAYGQPYMVWNGFNNDQPSAAP